MCVVCDREERVHTCNRVTTSHVLSPSTLTCFDLFFKNNFIYVPNVVWSYPLPTPLQPVPVFLPTSCLLLLFFYNPVSPMLMLPKLSHGSQGSNTGCQNFSANFFTHGLISPALNLLVLFFKVDFYLKNFHAIYLNHIFLLFKCLPDPPNLLTHSISCSLCLQKKKKRRKRNKRRKKTKMPPQSITIKKTNTTRPSPKTMPAENRKHTKEHGIRFVLAICFWAWDCHCVADIPRDTPLQKTDCLFPGRCNHK